MKLLAKLKKVIKGEVTVKEASPYVYPLLDTKPVEGINDYYLSVAKANNKLFAKNADTTANVVIRKRRKA